MSKISRVYLASLAASPYAIGGRGPDVFDCWGLIYHVYAKFLQITLPVYPNIDILHAPAMMESAARLTDWKEIKEPSDCCVAAMKRGSHIVHVGLWLDHSGGIFLHATPEAGVIAEGRERLSLRRYNDVLFFQWSKLS